MTDEQRPWREWPEYQEMLDLVAVTGATKHPELDALCARVWREAHKAARGTADTTWHDYTEAFESGAAYEQQRTDAERTRADAAEAQRDRLAAALSAADLLAERARALNEAVGKLPGDMLEDWHLFTEWEMSCLRHGEYIDARAALADVPEEEHAD